MSDCVTVPKNSKPLHFETNVEFYAYLSTVRIPLTNINLSKDAKINADYWFPFLVKNVKLFGGFL